MAARKSSAKAAAEPRKANPEDYPSGSVKQDPVTKAIAVRTAPPLQFPWAVMTLSNGGHYAQHSDVEGWVDIDGTPVPDPEPEPEPVEDPQDEEPTDPETPGE